MLSERVGVDPVDYGRADSLIRGIDVKHRPPRERPLSPLGDDVVNLDEAVRIAGLRSGYPFLATVLHRTAQVPIIVGGPQSAPILRLHDQPDEHGRRPAAGGPTSASSGRTVGEHHHDRPQDDQRFVVIIIRTTIAPTVPINIRPSARRTFFNVLRDESGRLARQSCREHGRILSGSGTRRSRAGSRLSSRPVRLSPAPGSA